MRIHVMAKKKKKTKVTEHQQRKLDAAHRLKTYTRRVVAFVQRMQLEEFLPLLDKRLVQAMYHLRANPIKLDMSRAQLFDGVAIKSLQNFFYSQCSSITVPFLENEADNNGRLLSPVDFNELLMPLGVLLGVEHPTFYRQLKDPLKARIVKCITLNEDYESDIVPEEDYFLSLYTRTNEAVENFILGFCMQVSNPVSYYLYLEDAELAANPLSDKMNVNIKLVTQKGVPKVFVADGKKRWGFRVKNVLNIQEDWQVKAPYHPQLNTNPEKIYSPYIMEHAVNRLFERIDGVMPYVVNFFFNRSIVEWNAEWYKGSLMITYHIMQKKLGYFVADIVGNKILIRTFLFLTYNRTFEGELLNRSTGFEKLDKKYLNIDKLSTFLASKIERNSFAGKIFSNAKCGHLLDLATMSVFVKNDKAGSSITNEFLMKYLKKNEENIG